MSVLCLLTFIFTLYEVSSVPIVLKESTPNGESIIAISSSDPEVEKYLLNSFTAQRSAPEHSLLRSNFYSPDVQGYNSPRLNNYGISASESFHPGTSRNFDESPHINPFFVPFLLPPNLGGLNNWFRNIENVYENPDPSSSGDGEVRRVTAVNDNGHVYGKVETVRSDSKKP